MKTLHWSCMSCPCNDRVCYEDASYVCVCVVWVSEWNEDKNLSTSRVC